MPRASGVQLSRGPLIAVPPPVFPARVLCEPEPSPPSERAVRKSPRRAGTGADPINVPFSARLNGQAPLRLSSVSPTPSSVSQTAGKASLLPHGTARRLAGGPVSNTQVAAPDNSLDVHAGKGQASWAFHPASAGPELGWIPWAIWRQVRLSRGLASLPVLLLQAWS